MSNPYQDHADGLAELQAELGGDCPVITWNSTDIKILPGSVALRSRNSEGGISLDADFACSCLVKDFASLPKANQSISYRGKSLKISAVRIAAGGFQYRIEAMDAAQKI